MIAHDNGILPSVMKVKTNKQLLNDILKTTQMGQIGIRTVEDQAVKSELKKALASQRKEYDEIESEARSIAESRGWQLNELNPAIRATSEMMSKMQLIGGNRDSKIAGMMIQGNTKGIIMGIKSKHQNYQTDARILDLSEKLLATEDRNIEQMKPYL